MSRTTASRFSAAVALIFAAALSIAWAPAVTRAATISGNQTIKPRQSNGRYDALYLDGNDSSPLQWGTIPNIQIYVGDSCAFNLRTLGALAGTNAATATLSKVSGTLPTGCSVGTDGITGTATAASSGTFVWRATDGTPADSNSFGLTVVALPVVDATAPTVPTKCSGTGGVGEVTITCDPSSDPYVGEAGSGVSAYKIYLGGSLVATKTAPSANAQPVLTQYLVGGTDGTVTNTQSGADRLLGFGGVGLTATADQFIGVGHQVNGNFTASTTLTSYTSSVTTHQGGLIVYANPADASCSGNACAPYFACRIRGSDGKPQARYRSGTGVSAANGALGAAVSLPYRARVELTASGYQCLTSSDGNTWTATEAPRLLSLGATPYVMAYCTSGTAGQTAQCDLDQVHITTSAPWSQAVTTDTGGSWQVEAWDAVTPTANKSAKGTAFTAVPTAPGGGSPPTTACTAAEKTADGLSALTLAHYDDFDDAALHTDRWNDANCLGYDAYAPSQDTCPAPSTAHARSGDRSLRTRLTFHDGTVTDAPAWSSGASYSVGDEVTSGASTPMTFRWRSKTNHGPTASSPANDSTNWETWDHWYHKGDYGKTADNAHRTELSIKNWSANSFATSQLTKDVEQWYAFSLYLLGSGDSSGDPALDPSTSNYYYFINWQLHDVPDTYDTTATSVPSSTTVVLASGASTENGYYVGTITIGGQTRNISGYVGSTRTVTVSSAFSPTPSPGAVTIKEPSRNPPLVISIGKTGSWSCSNWYQSKKFAAKGDAEGSNACSGTMGAWTSDVGGWTDFVVRLKARGDNDGILEIWKDGAKVYSHFGPTWPNDDVVGYLKMGIYAGHFSPGTNIPSDWPQRQGIFLDGHRLALATRSGTAAAVGTDDCGYREVAPSGTAH